MGGPIDIAQRGWQWVIHDHDHDHLVTKVRCMDLPDSDRGDFTCRRAVDSSSWTLRNKLQWNFNQYSNIFIQENAFENVVCEMASILSRLQCVKADNLVSMKTRCFKLVISCLMTTWWWWSRGISRYSIESVSVGYLNSLAPEKFEWYFRYLIFQMIIVIDGWGISCELALRWMSLDLTDDKSTLVQVMAWCRQATSHYLRQWWPRSLSPYGVTRPQRVQCQNRGVTLGQKTIMLMLFSIIIEIQWQFDIALNQIILMNWLL